MDSSIEKFHHYNELVQRNLSNNTNGLAVAVVDQKKVNVYCSVGTVADNSPEFLRSLTWIGAMSKDNHWICKPIDNDLRDKFIVEMVE